MDGSVAYWDSNGWLMTAIMFGQVRAYSFAYSWAVNDSDWTVSKRLITHYILLDGFVTAIAIGWLLSCRF